MKITMYELLGMIKDDKAPKKIKYQDEEYILNKICLEDNKTHIDYYLKGRELLLFEDIVNIVLDINDEVEILEEEKKIPEKLENEHEFYSYAKYEENKNEIDKVLYILKAINLIEEKIGNLNNSVNSIIDYLKSKGE